MPSTDWRSPAAYAHAKSISAAGFAWEYLRRDEDYRRDFHRVRRLPRLDSDAQTAFSERWGGGDFPTDPTLSADRAALFWMQSLLPDAFELRPSACVDSDPASMTISLPTLPGLDARATEDGKWHGLWRSAGVDHQFWLADPPSGTKTAYFVMLPLDASLEHRAEAVSRFWRTLMGRPIGERRHALPAQTRDRHILILRALDGRTDGASYRKIAETLLGFRGDKTAWEIDPRKNQARRLVADGTHYVRGGYRELLHYPTRLPRVAQT